MLSISRIDHVFWILQRHPKCLKQMDIQLLFWQEYFIVLYGPSMLYLGTSLNLHLQVALC